jgi:serine/threonine protein kinase
VNNVIAVPYFEQVESAKTPSDLFADADKARSTYRRLARIIHPDANHSEQRAVDAFAKLSRMWDEYNGKSTGPRVAAPATNAPHSVIYETKRHTFFVGDLAKRTEYANIYPAEYMDESIHRYAALKMPRSPKNNDLIENEVTALKTLKDSVPAQYQMYHPTTIDTFMHRDKVSGKQRRAIVTNALPGFVSLREVLDAYPKGIPPRQVAWIARRLWIALDTAHEAGIAHGAVFPENVMIHGTDHGVVLIEWSYSQPLKSKLQAAVPRYQKEDWYGPGLTRRLDHRLDVRLAAKTLAALLGEQDARRFRAFFNGCQVASTPTAGQLFGEFDELLTEVYGERKYVPFEMPQGWKREA